MEEWSLLLRPNGCTLIDITNADDFHSAIWHIFYSLTLYLFTLTWHHVIVVTHCRTGNPSIKGIFPLHTDNNLKRYSIQDRTQRCVIVIVVVCMSMQVQDEVIVVKYSRCASTPGMSKVSPQEPGVLHVLVLSLVQHTWIKWWLIEPLQNFDLLRR